MMLRETLDQVLPGPDSSSDKLRRLFSIALGAQAAPSRQKISDILAGRREAPPAIRAKLRDLEARASLVAALSQALGRFGVSVLWSLPEDFLLNPDNAQAVADELRHGNLEAFRFAAQIRNLDQAWNNARERAKNALA